jgi:ATP-binding cassette, subfamily F, member 3
MISITNLNKAYGHQVLFQNASLLIGQNERIGLIGRNGSGKSTFLKMLLNKEEPESISIPKTISMSSLEQHLEFEHSTLLLQVCSALPADSLHDDWKAKSLLMGLGFTETDFDAPPKSFSSGFQIRIRLAEALIAQPDLLLLDEPTNYLDILSLRWLSTFLKSWRGALILVSHDRHFMTEVVTHTIAIHRGGMRKMKGGPQKIRDQIDLEEEVHEKTRLGQEKKQKKTEEFIRTFRAGARSAGLVQSRIKSLEKQDVHEKLSKIPQITFRFHSEPFHGDSLLKANNISFAYGQNQMLFQGLSLTANTGDRIAVIGRNGKGKSTLLKVLAGKLQSPTGSVKPHVNLQQGFFGAESIEQLNKKRTILEELRTMPNVTEQELRNLCGSLLFSGDDAKKNISNISGGEKSRVCLGKVMLYNSHLLFLDEPTNHLDMESCEALVEAIKKYDGTVIFVSHDEDMVSDLANRLIIFDGGTAVVREQTYQQFLDAGGWTEEEEQKELKSGKPISDNKAQYLKTKEDQKKLRALRKRQSELEKELKRLEVQKQTAAEHLQFACNIKDYDQMKAVGQRMKDIERKYEQALEELEQVMDEEIVLSE